MWFGWGGSSSGSGAGDKDVASTSGTDAAAEMRAEGEPAPLTDAEKSAVEKMRENLRRLGLPIEPELETDFYLSRWLREFKGNAEAAERGARDYLESRHAAGLDLPDYPTLWQHQRLIKTFLPFLSLSKFSHRVVNKVDNSVVVFGRAAGLDHRKLALMMRSSEIINTYFAYGEYVMRQVVAQERESGKSSGAICVFDLSELHVSEFVTSGSALLHVSRMTINVMQKWYNTEGLRALIFVNPPRIMMLSWTFAKLIMSEGTRRKVHLFPRPAKQLPTLLSEDCIPEAFGGKLRDDSGWCQVPELCVNAPRAILPEHYASAGEVWTRFGLQASPLPALTTAYVPKKGSFRLERKAERSGERLAWMFSVNGEVDFQITKTSGERGRPELVYPRMTLTTVKLPEEDVLICEADTVYSLTWTNSAALLFDLRLDYALTLAPAASAHCPAAKE